ncbi:MAG TPA: DUF2971 domain-containing protein [Bacteroidales bacterium]|nr:DUF2971 domain-containing protein [Bacteroidales bacterium]
MIQDQEQDKNLQVLFKIATKHFGHSTWDSYGISGERMDITLSELNKKYKATPYFLNTPIKIIHWTSLNNLFSILNEKSIRLYNLDASDDDEEMNYAGAYLGIDPKIIENAKRNFFSMSFCTAEDINSHHMWCDYGKNYNNAAIEFCIENDSNSWLNFMFAKIHYSPPANLHAFLQDVKEQITDKGLGFFVDFCRLLGFHKKADFNNENEVRIATYFPIKDFETNMKYIFQEPRLKENRNRIAKYLRLPLWINLNGSYVEKQPYVFAGQKIHGDEFFIDKPKIKISNIYFGENCGLSMLDLQRFQSAISTTLKFNHGYDIEFYKGFFKCIG